MKRVILTVGPMYAGKTTFCRRLRELVPSIGYIRRDDILERHFGSAWVSPYECPPGFVEQQLQHAIALAMGPKAGEAYVLIVDTWNDCPRDRAYYCSQFRRYEADRIEGWFFVTPPEACLAHSFLREPVEEKDPKTREWRRKWRQEAVLRDTAAFYAKNPPSPQTETWFDEVRVIRPLVDDPGSWVCPPSAQLRLPGMDGLLPTPVLRLAIRLRAVFCRIAVSWLDGGWGIAYRPARRFHFGRNSAP